MSCAESQVALANAENAGNGDIREVADLPCFVGDASVRSIRKVRRWRSRNCGETPVSLTSGGNAVDKGVRQGHRRWHVAWWKLSLEAAARGSKDALTSGFFSF